MWQRCNTCLPLLCIWHCQQYTLLCIQLTLKLCWMLTHWSLFLPFWPHYLHQIQKKLLYIFHSKIKSPIFNFCPIKIIFSEFYIWWIFLVTWIILSFSRFLSSWNPSASQIRPEAQIIDWFHIYNLWALFFILISRK